MSRSSPRVLHFTPFEGLAGANRSCLTLVEEQARRRPTFVMSLFEGEFSTAAAATGAEARPVFPAADGETPLWQRLPKWQRMIHAVRAIRRAIDDWRIDLVHCHSPRGVRYTYPAVLGKRTPLLTHQRDNYERNYFHLGLGRSDHLVAISEWVKQTLPGRMQRKSTVVYNAVQLPSDELVTSCLEERSITIGMPGRCEPEKGLDILLNALPSLNLDTPFSVRAVGVSAPDRDDYSRQVHAIVAGYNDELRKRVHLEPFRADIENFYASVDVVVMPSRFHEPFGRVAIEAMAWRRPVVVSNRGGLPEIVDHGRTGLIFDADDVSDLAQKLNDLLADGLLRERLAHEGREEVKRRFLPGPHADAIDAIYEKML